MTGLKSICVVLLPVFILLTFVFVSSHLIFVAPTHALEKSISSLRSEERMLHAKINELVSLDEATHQKFQMWEAKNIGEASLQLQSSISRIANDANIPENLLGPYGEEQNNGYSTFSVEFETETNLADVLVFIAELENMTPWVAIGEMTVRPISDFSYEAEGTLVYVRLILKGVFRDISS